MYVMEEQEIKKAISELSSFRVDESGTKILWLTERGPKVVGEIGKFGIDLMPGVRQLLDWNSRRELKKLDAFLRSRRIMVVRDAGSCPDGA